MDQTGIHRSLTLHERERLWRLACTDLSCFVLFAIFAILSVHAFGVGFEYFTTWALVFHSVCFFVAAVCSFQIVRSSAHVDAAAVVLYTWALPAVVSMATMVFFAFLVVAATYRDDLSGYDLKEAFGAHLLFHTAPLITGTIVAYEHSNVHMAPGRAGCWGLIVALVPITTLGIYALVESPRSVYGVSKASSVWLGFASVGFAVMGAVFAERVVRSDVRSGVS